MQSLRQLISERASEQVIQLYLKENLHIIGKSCAYSPIGEEHLAFSEFAIKRGKVDFCVFCDRSRMAVVLIEVKGADFAFINANGSVNANINEAARQIRERVEYALTDEFRQEAHEIRRLTLAGKCPFRHAIGKDSLPYVDPNKPLQIRSIVIGGYTSNDIEESRERHRMERHDPRTRFESWDSWLRKQENTGGTFRNTGS